MKRKTALLIVVMALSIAFVLSGCGGGKNNSGTEENREDVVIAIEAMFGTLDPKTLAFVNVYLLNQMYEKLVSIDDDGVISPCLAESWEISPDNLTYTFHLKQGVKFHNGDILTADDVVYSYQRAADLGTMIAFTKGIKNLYAPDANTFVVEREAPSMAFLSYTAEIPVLNAKFTEEVGEKIREQACGTGPYKLVSFKDTECIMTRFDDYREGPAVIKDVVFKVIPDFTTASTALETGEIDFLMFISPAPFFNVKDNPNLNTALLEAHHCATLTYNTQKAPFNDVRVRQALNYAIDKDTIIQVAYEGLAVPSNFIAKQPFCPWADFSGIELYEYNPEKAKALFAEAGVTDIGVFSVTSSYRAKVAQVVQQNLADIGIKVELREVEENTYYASIETGDFTIGNMGLPYEMDIDYTLDYYASASAGYNNSSWYINPEADALIKAGVEESDPAVRQQIYTELLTILTEDAPYMPLFHKQTPFAWNKDLNAFPHASTTRPYLVKEWSWDS